MAMHKTSILVAALIGTLVIGTPALARHGGGGGGTWGGGSSMKGGPSGAAPSAAPSMGGSRMNSNFGPSNGAMRWSGNRQGTSGMAPSSGQWRSNRMAGNFDHHGHHHRHHGGFFPFGVFASGDYGYYDNYYYDYPYDDSYEDCYIRHVRIHGHWVRRRYCEY
jgi:hypothetical protein